MSEYNNLFGSDDDDDDDNDDEPIGVKKHKGSSDENENDAKDSESDEKMDDDDDDDREKEDSNKDSSSSSSDDDDNIVKEMSDDEVRREKVDSEEDPEEPEEDADAEDAEERAKKIDSDDSQSNHEQETQKDNREAEDEAMDDDEHKADNAVADEDRIGNDNAFIDDEEAPEVIPETRFDVEIPRIVADLGKELHFVKLPNFISVETHPFDPQWYEDEIDEDEMLDEEGRSRLKLKVENTIRWRNVIDQETGELKKESNTRIVRWSDGSTSLHLGDEIFDVHKLQMMASDNNHLFIRQGTGLLGQAVFKTKLSFRPYSTESFTHRKLTLSLADRSQKTQKIRVLPNVGKDPEAHRSEMIKKEEDRLKASIRRENKMRRVRERSLIRGPTASYLEPDGDDDEDEEGGISIAKIKKQYKSGAFTRYDSDSGEDTAVKGKETQDDDDSDLDLGFDKRKSSDTKKKQIVESEDDDE